MPEVSRTTPLAEAPLSPPAAGQILTIPAEAGRLPTARQAQAEAWLREAVRDRFGRDGLARAAAQSQNFRLSEGQSPFSRLAELAGSLHR